MYLLHWTNFIETKQNNAKFFMINKSNLRSFIFLYYVIIFTINSTLYQSFIIDPLLGKRYQIFLAHSLFTGWYDKIVWARGIATYDLAMETSRNIVAKSIAEGIRSANALKATIFHSSLKVGWRCHTEHTAKSVKCPGSNNDAFVYTYAALVNRLMRDSGTAI